MGERKLTINISVNSARAVASLQALGNSLGQLITAGTVGNMKQAAQAAAQLGSSAAGSGAKVAAAGKSMSSSIDGVLAALKKASKTSAEARAAYGQLKDTLAEFGPKSKQVAAALAAGTKAIETYGKTLSKVGRGDSDLFASSLIKVGAGLRNLSLQIRRTVEDAKGGIGAGPLVAGLSQQLTQQANAAKRALEDLAIARKKYLDLLTAKRAGDQTVDTASIRAAKADVDRLTIAVRNENATLQALAPTLVAAAQATRSLDAAQKSAAAAAKANAAALAVQSSALANTRGDIQGLIDTNRRNAYSMTIMGYQAKFAGDQIINSFKGAVDTFTEFDFSVRRSAVALGLLDQGSGKAQLALGDFADEYQRIAIQAKLFSPEEVAKGFYYWGSTTGQVARSMAELRAISEQILPVMKAAAMTGTDLETALKGVYAITEQFGIGVGSASKVINTLFLVTQKTALELPDLLNSFKMVGPVAAKAGVSFQDMATLMGAIGDAGIKGTMAGRAFRQFFIRLAKDSALTTKLLDNQVKTLGGWQQTWDELVFPEGKFIGMQGTLNAFSQVTAKLSQHQKEQVLASASTAAEYPVLIQLVDANTKALTGLNGELDLNRKGIIDVYNEQKNLASSSKSVEEQWAIMGESAKAVLGQMRNRIAPLTILIGQTLFEAFRPIAKTIGDIAEATTRWAKANPEIFAMVVKVTALTGALMAIAGAVLLVVGAFKLLTGTILREFAMALIGNNLQITTNTSSLGLLNTALLVTKARMSGLVGMKFPKFAIPGAGSQLVSGQTGIGASLHKAKVGIAANGGVAAVGLQKIVALFKLAATASGGFGRLIVGLSSKFLVFAAAGAVIAGIVKGLFRAFGGTSNAASALGGAISGIGKAFSTVSGLLASTIKFFVKGGEAIVYLGAMILDVIPGIDLIGKALGGLGDIVRNVFGFIGDAFGWATEQLDGMVKSADAAMETLDRNRGRGPKGPEDGFMGQSALHQREAYGPMMARIRANQAAETVKAIYEENQQFADAQADAFAKHQKFVEEAAMRGVFVPVQLVMSNLAALAEEDGHAVPVQFAGGMYRSIGEFDAAAASIGNSLIAQLSSVSAKVRDQGRDAMVAYATSFRDSGVAAVPAAANAALSAAIEAMKSKSPAFRKNGAELLAAFTDAISTGKYEQVVPQMQSMMKAALDQITSGRPAARKEGAAFLAAAARGLAESTGASDAVKGQIEAQIALMSSADPAMQALGANWIISQVNGMAEQIPAMRELALHAGRDVVRFMAAGMNGEQARAMAATRMTTKLKDIFFKPTVGGVSATDPPTTKGSGGGGSKSIEQSPLEKALEVAKNGVELAESLQKLKGVNLKALVQSAMGGVAEAMALSVSITHKYSKGVGNKVLQQVATFSESAGKVASLIGAAVDAFAKLATFKPISAGALGLIVSSISEATAAIAEVSKKSKDLGKSAGEFSDNAGKVVGTIGSAFDSFAKIGEFKPVSHDSIQNLVNAIDQSLRMLGEKAKAWTEKDGDLGAISDFADAASKVAGALAAMFSASQGEVVAALQEGETRVFPVISELIAKMDETMSAADVLAVKFKDKTQPIKDMAEAASSVANAIKSFFDIASTSKDGDGKEVNLVNLVQTTLDGILSSAQSFAASFSTIGISFIASLVDGMKSQESLLAAEVAQINAILSGVGGTSTVSFSVATTARPIEINHTVTGDVGNLTADQVAAILNRGTSSLLSNLSQSAGVR